MKYTVVFLAGPGMLFGTAAIGLLVNALVPVSGLDFSECETGAWLPAVGFLLGAVLSATDPVAVVALLKELGVPADLSTLVEGESLLNDGTALVVYMILVTAAEGTFEMQPVDVAWAFVKMSLGGVVFGVLMGFLSVQWLGRIFNDAMVEITITLAAPYLTFYIAENYLGVSGVLALVALGLYFGMEGRSRISPEVQHFLGEFWELLAYFGNTLIFLVSGLVIAKQLPAVDAAEVWLLGVLYVFSHLVRVASVGSVSAFQALRGRPTNLSYDLVSIWGGLRGAVGLALALLVYNSEVMCARYRDVVLFQTAGLVVLTVVINGSTMRWLLLHLGVDKVHSSRLMIFNQAVRALKDSETEQETLLKLDSLFDNADWDIVRRFYFKVPQLKVIDEQLLEDSANEAKMDRWATVREAVWEGPGNKVRKSIIGKRGSTTATLGTQGPGVGRKSITGKRDSAVSKLGTQPPEWRASAANLFSPNRQPPTVHKTDQTGKSEHSSAEKAALERRISRFNPYAPFVSEHDVKEARRRLLMVCKKSYWKQFEMGLLSQEAAKFLMYTTDKAVDRGCQLREWNYFESVLTTFQEGTEETVMEQKNKAKALWLLDSAPFFLLVAGLVTAELVLMALAPGGHGGPLRGLAAAATLHGWLTVAFTLEMATRLYLLGDFMNFFRDPYVVVELAVVIMMMVVFYHPLRLGRAGYVVPALRLLRGAKIAAAVRKRLRTRKGLMRQKTAHHHMWVEADGYLDRLKRNFIYHRVQFDYEVVCGFLSAREEGLQVMSNVMEGAGKQSGAHFAYVREQALVDIRHAKHRLELMAQHYTEISKSMATYVAARTVLNRQRTMVDHLHHEGLLDHNEAGKMHGAIEHQMKMLLAKPPSVKLPDKDALLRSLEWTENLPEDVILSMKKYLEDIVTTTGQRVIQKGEMGSHIYIVARGNFSLYDPARKQKKEIGTLSMGTTFGEISWAMGGPRLADVISLGPGLLYKINGDMLKSLCAFDPAIAESLWDFVARRVAENLLYKESSVAMTRRMIKQTLMNYEHYFVPQAQIYTFAHDAILVLVCGRAELLDGEHTAPLSPRRESSTGSDGGGGGGGDANDHQREHPLPQPGCWECADAERAERERRTVLQGPVVVQVKSDLMAFRIRFQRNVRFVAEPAAFQLGGDDRPKLRTRPLLSALSSHLSTPLHKGSAPGHKGSTPSVGQHLLPIHKNSISSVAQNLLSRNVPVTESHTLSLDQLKRKHSVNKIEIPSQDAPNGLRKGSRSTVVVPLPQLPKKMEFAEISSVCSTPLHRLVKAGSQRHHSGRGGPKRRMSSSRLSRGKPIGRSGGDEDGPGSAGLLKQHLNPDTAAVVSPKANKKPQVDDFEPHPALAEGLHDHNEEHDNGQESHQTTSTGNIADQQRKNSHVSVEGVVARGVGGLRDSLKLKGIGRKVLPGLSTNQVEDRIVSYYADEEQKEPFFNMDDGLGALQSTLESPANIKSSNSKKQLLAQDSAENFSVISDQQSDYNV
uniref:Cyclic nucleotide-binding domain-containing protein n=1 Tax=Heterosigma akashiwo TaxID=2829 RepID=A0A7S3XLW5_HETAK